MYPKSFTDVIALLAALIPLILFALSNLQTARTATADRERADWVRIQELIAVVSNPANGDKHYSLWQQELAAEELSTFAGKQKAIVDVLTAARDHFKSYREGEELGRQIDKILVRLDQH